MDNMDMQFTEEGIHKKVVRMPVTAEGFKGQKEIIPWSNPGVSVESQLSGFAILALSDQNTTQKTATSVLSNSKHSSEAYTSSTSVAFSDDVEYSALMASEEKTSKSYAIQQPRHCKKLERRYRSKRLNELGNPQQSRKRFQYKIQSLRQSLDSCRGLAEELKGCFQKLDPINAHEQNNKMLEGK